MTGLPQSGDGSPAVAALATHVNALRRELKSLAAKVEVLTSTQREHVVVLNGISELRRQVEQVLAILAEEDDTSPAAWFWLTMTDQERDEKFGELSDWVETVLRAQYPDYLADQIRPCWPNHPEARWELAWLYQQWSLAYLAKRPTPRDAADWHDRWSPGVLHRLSRVMARCETGCHRHPSLAATRDQRPGSRCNRRNAAAHTRRRTSRQEPGSRQRPRRAGHRSWRATDPRRRGRSSCHAGFGCQHGGHSAL